MMDKLRETWKSLRLTLLFTTMVFLIILLTMILACTGVLFLSRLGVIDSVDSERLLLLLFFAVTSLAMGTILAVLFSHRPLKPIRQIMDASDRIAAGDYSVRIHLGGPEAFRKLSGKFNHMAEELGSVEMLRSDFVNNFSHEFKTPIVSIRGYAKMLKRDDLTAEERAEYLEIIIDESERLADLATNVLNLSRVEQQTILTDRKRFNVSEQIRLVVALLDSKWADKQMEFALDCNEVFISGNEELLKQVWINLIDNAIKFSPDRGRIDIQIKQSAEGTAVRVADQGGGISEETAAHIFDKFYQGDLSHATKGNGLGLAIAKRIVRLHEGSIELAGTGPEGTVFEVRL